MRMQPSNTLGRRTRFALMPVSWVMAALTVYALLLILATISRSSIGDLLRTDSLWPLIVILPALILGKVLGLMVVNLIAVWTPPLRKIFEDEQVETGRCGFAKVMAGLTRGALALAILTAFGSWLFLRYR